MLVKGTLQYKRKLTPMCHRDGRASRFIPYALGRSATTR
jgi:hypothetical protein